MLEMEKEDNAALVNILGSIFISLFALAMIIMAASVFHWNTSASDQLASQAINQTVDRSEEGNRSMVKIPMPFNEPELAPEKKNNSFNLSVDGCSKQDFGPMVEFRIRSNLNETQNLSLYVDGINVSEYRYNRMIKLLPLQRLLVNTFINQSLLIQNGSNIAFILEIKEGENLVDTKNISCVFSGGGASSSSVSVPVSAPTPPVPVLTRIEVIPSSISMPEGAVKTFEAKGYDQLNNLMEIIFDWTSSNQTVGTVNNKGVFNATSPGTAEVVASNGSISGKATVVVREEPISNPTPTPTSAPTVVLTPTQTRTPLPTPEITITPGPTSTLTPVPTPVITPIPAVCDLYAVHDEGVGDSQFIKINLTNRSASVLGPKYANYDFKGLDLDPITGDLFAGAGDEGNHGGKIYKINIETGAKTLVGDTGFKGIEALAFRPNGSIWVWAADKGLAEINKNNSSVKLVYPSKTGIEGLAWNNQGTVLYASAGNKLYSYNFSKNVLVRLTSNLPGETEALEIKPDGMLLGGIHNSDSISIFTYDPVALRVVAEDNFTLPYNDIEGIAWPSDCPVR